MATTTPQKSLPKYRLLGSSGLRVFPLSLGTMHFGETIFVKHGVGQKAEEAEKILLRYIEVGGNFIDTANFYGFGQSEEWIGKFLKKNNVDREKLIIATKYSLPTVSGDPNAAGNSKKNLFRSVNDSLKRLQVDYIDILYVHFWDWSVNPEDLIRDLNDVIQTGKVLHVAASDLPAWVVCQANMAAKHRGSHPFIAYQGKYSLVERSLDQEIIPFAKSFNVATVPWGALGQGKLTGSRTRENPNNGGRTNVVMSEQDFIVQDEVVKIAKEIGRTPSQVALNWAMHKTTSPLLGPKTLEQLEDNLGALQFDLTPDQIERLDQVSKSSPAPIFPYNWIGPNTAQSTFLHAPNFANPTYRIEQ